MRKGCKTSKECRLAWATEFLAGDGDAITHHKKMMAACKGCSHYDECYPAYETLSPEQKRQVDSLSQLICDAALEETMGKQ